MTKKSGKELYEPPIIINLSAFSANGQQEPLGTCVGGNVPYSGCVAGTSVFPPDCSPGAEVETYPQCRGGSMASSTCLTGGQAG